MSDRIAVMNQGRYEQLGDPETLYERPTTRFVAGFLGVSNLLRGRCQGADGAFATRPPRRRVHGPGRRGPLVDGRERRRRRRPAREDPPARAKESELPTATTISTAPCATPSYIGVSTQYIVETARWGAGHGLRAEHRTHDARRSCGHPGRTWSISPGRPTTRSWSRPRLPDAVRRPSEEHHEHEPTSERHAGLRRAGRPQGRGPRRRRRRSSPPAPGRRSGAAASAAGGRASLAAPVRRVRPARRRRSAPLARRAGHHRPAHVRQLARLHRPRRAPPATPASTRRAPRRPSRSSRSEYGVEVDYQEKIGDNEAFVETIKPALVAGLPTGWDLMVLTDWMAVEDRDQRLGREDRPRRTCPTAVANLARRAQGHAVGPDNDYHYPWQSGMTGVGYNAKTLTENNIAEPTKIADLWNIPADKMHVPRPRRATRSGSTLLKLGIDADPARRSPTTTSRRSHDDIKPLVDEGLRFTGNEYLQDFAPEEGLGGDRLVGRPRVVGRRGRPVHRPRGGRDDLDRQHAHPEGRGQQVHGRADDRTTSTTRRSRPRSPTTSTTSRRSRAPTRRSRRSTRTPPRTRSCSRRRTSSPSSTTSRRSATEQEDKLNDLFADLSGI